MPSVKYSSAYKRAYKKLAKSGQFPKEALEGVIRTIQRGERLGAKYFDHELSGELSGHRECHIKFNLLLVYRIENDNLVLVLVNLGSHSGIFK